MPQSPSACYLPIHKLSFVPELRFTHSSYVLLLPAVLQNWNFLQSIDLKPLLRSVSMQLYSMYVGDGEALLRDTFHRARLAAPAILFLDEIDGLVPGREAGGGGAEGGPEAGMRLLATMLTEMDGLEGGAGGGGGGWGEGGATGGKGMGWREGVVEVNVMTLIFGCCLERGAAAGGLGDGGQMSSRRGKERSSVEKDVGGSSEAQN